MTKIRLVRSIARWAREARTALWGVCRRGGTLAGTPLRAGLLVFALVLIAAPHIVFGVGQALAQSSVGAPDLLGDADPGCVCFSPDRIDDVPALKPDVDNFPEMANFSWRAFAALNWPSRTGPGERGRPDRTKTLGDPGPRVWETLKSRFELFQVGPDGRPAAPPPWTSEAGANPCGAEANGRGKTLASFEPFMDFNQFSTTRVAANPLVAQNRTYTRYETRLNELAYSAIARNGWGESPPDQENPARFPVGSIAVKAAWRLLTASDSPAVRARYYVVEGANVVDVAKTVAAGRVVCAKSDVALVGLHIVIRTARRPQGLWSTFEHVDNVPPVGQGLAREPDARDAGAPYSYFNAQKPKLGLWPPPGSPGALPVSLARPPKIDPEPMQVVRRYPIHLSTMQMNRAYWALPGIKGSVWERYMLVAIQWPTRAYPVDPHNDGAFFPEVREENLVNTAIETYLQDSTSSCMGCHQTFNARGRDFVGMLGGFR